MIGLKKEETRSNDQGECCGGEIFEPRSWIERLWFYDTSDCVLAPHRLLAVMTLMVLEMHRTIVLLEEEG